MPHAEYGRIFQVDQATCSTSVPTTEVEASPFNLQRALRGLNVVVNDNAEQKPLPSLDIKIFRDGRKPAPRLAFTLRGLLIFRSCSVKSRFSRGGNIGPLRSAPGRRCPRGDLTRIDASGFPVALLPPILARLGFYTYSRSLI
jgi:hypothetical protein